MANRDVADFLKSTLLEAAGFRHAFFTRRGGVSEGPHASLNFSGATGDTLSHVRQNVLRGASALKVAPEQLFALSQVHGTDVHVLGPDSDAERILATEGDALVSARAGLACGVRTADCVPVLLASPDTGVVGAAHAGWRGAAAGVVSSTVAVMRENGARGPLIAAIGPHISVAAFEVSEEVAEQLTAAAPGSDVVDRSFGDRPHVNLRKLIRAQLRALDVTEVDDVDGCTVADPELFFSYRRDGAVGGRHLSAIVSGRER